MLGKRARYNKGSGGYKRGSLVARVPRGIRNVIPYHVIKRIGTPLIISTSAGTNSPAVGNNYEVSSGAAFMSLTPLTPLITDNLIQHTQWGGSLIFNMAALGSSSTDITNLFDNYRIKKVRLMFSYSANSSDVGAGTQVNMALPLMHYCTDPDASTFPADENTVLQNEKVRSRRLGDGIFYVDVYPRAQQAVATTNVGTGAVYAGGLLPSNTWLDCQGTAVNHYGFSFWMRSFPKPVNTGFQACLTITPKYYMECKNQI